LVYIIEYESYWYDNRGNIKYRMIKIINLLLVYIIEYESYWYDNRGNIKYRMIKIE
jgi:uncharacterized protein YcfL